MYKESVDRYFKDVQQTTANYLQSVTDLQQEIVDSRKLTLDSVITIQQTLSDQYKPGQKVPDSATELVNYIFEQSSRAVTVQNKLILTSLETLLKNIKTFNDNSKTFSKLNSDIMDYWLSAFVKKNE